MLRGNYVFTRKAEDEMFVDNLTEQDVVESIINADEIWKVVRSRSRARSHKYERLYIIESQTYGGILVYTKGVIRKQAGESFFYVLISAKRSR